MSFPGIRRVFRISRARGVDRQAIDDELRFHIDTRTAELAASGLDSDAARRIALREFGNAAQYLDECAKIDITTARHTRLTAVMDALSTDVRYGLRQLRRQPRFVLVACTTLALGIGATAAMLSIVNGALFAPLPFRDAARIVRLGVRDSTKPGPAGVTSVQDYLDWTRSAKSFSSLGVMMNATATLTGRGDADRVGIALVSSGILQVFGVKPFLGRPLTAGDDAVGAASVALISYPMWVTRFGADSGVLHHPITLDGQSVEIIGVLPRAFDPPGRLARPVWENFRAYGDTRSNRSESVWAMLGPTATLAQAQAEMRSIAAHLSAEHVEDRGQTVVVDRLRDIVVGDLPRTLFVLFAAAAGVLLIACANVSNLLLARGVSRQGELALREALGARRGRLIMQMLIESGLLAVAGGAGGCAIAFVAVRGIAALGPDALRARPPVMSALTLTAAVVVVGSATVLAGLVPAIRLAPRFRRGKTTPSAWRSVTGRHAVTRRVFAATQLAVAVALLSVSLLVLKSFARVLTVDPGIHVDHVVTMQVSLPNAPRYDGQASTAFFSQLLATVRDLPGVAQAATTSLIPAGGDRMFLEVTRVRGMPERTGADRILADRYMVSPGYFETLGIPLRAGRMFTSADRVDAETVCVVDSVMARRVFGAADPLAQSIDLGGGRGYARVVGVVGHVKTEGLDADSPGQVYVSTAQYPWRWMSLVVRTNRDEASVAAAITRSVHELDPSQPVTNVAPLRALMSDQLRARRFALVVLGTFASAAMLLAVIGLYGVVAYGVVQRRREFGIRLALGARRSEIMRIVVAEGAGLAAAGGVAGIAIALAMSGVVASLLFQVKPGDAVTMTRVAVMLMVATLAACVVPARRASSVPLADVLRGE